MDIYNPNVMTGLAIFFFIALSIIARHRNKPYLKNIAWTILIVFGFIIPVMITNKFI
jgi:di/tricarboxylate transporter